MVVVEGTVWVGFTVVDVVGWSPGIDGELVVPSADQQSNSIIY